MLCNIHLKRRASAHACLAWLAVALAGMFLVPQAYGQADIYVTTTGSDPTGPSWALPTSLDNALAIATANDVIWVAQGTYTHSSTFTVTTEGLKIYGGFVGSETNLSERTWTNNLTLLSGQNTRRVTTIQANNVLLDGLIITNGYEASTDGAGIYMDNTGQNLTMFNCRVVGNTVWDDGAGAFFNNAGTVLLSNCVFQANDTIDRGAGSGFWGQNSTITLLNCEIRDNFSSCNDKREGKGFYLYDGTLIMVGTTVADNYLGWSDNSGPGAGGYIRAGTATFTNCIFTGNQATRSDGGGLYIASGNVTIDSCTFANNVSTTNSTEPEGGAIFQNGGTVTIRNSVFWGNEAGNDGNDGDTIYQDRGTLNISYSCFDGIELPRLRFVNGTWGDGIITNDPLFATEYTDVHLQSTVGRWNGTTWVTDATNSPCIDAGDPASSYANEPSGENGAVINMGAYGNTWEASKSTNEAPAVETVAEVVVANAAELRGELTAGSPATITFYYGLSNGLENPTDWNATNIISDIQSIGTVFSSVAGGLQTNTTYWFTVYATNAFGDDWGTPRSFVTGDAATGGGAGVIHVDIDAAGVEDGLSWTNAFTTFEDALAAAEDGLGTSIWIAEGTYQPKNTFIVQTDGLSVYGGFAGTETNLSERNWTNNECLLSGGRLVRVANIQADDILLDGVIITNGYIPYAGYHAAGLLMDDSGTNLTMLNCRITGNYLGSHDTRSCGAYFKNAGNVLLSNCVIRANQSTTRGNGTGFRSDNTTLTIIDCEIRDNFDSGNDQRVGKGFYLNGGSLTMTRTTVANNYFNGTSTAGNGGGGYISGTASFTNCIFADNRCQGSDGGGLYVNSGNVTIDSCTFVGNGGLTNSSNPEGGAIYVNSGTVNIKDSIFWDNQTGNDANDGDTIYQNAGTLNISYSCMDGIDLPRVRFVSGTWGDGIITNNPLFATDYTDVHLQSTVGRWDGSSWVTDGASSPCIDAGDPTSDYTNEPAGAHGARINMGAYGNTWEASKSANEPPIVETLAPIVVANAAELRGELTTGAVSTITFYYGLTDQGTNAAGWDATNVLSEGQSAGSIFSSVAGGLLVNTTYWFTVYATNAFGDDWGDAVSFVTGTEAPGGGPGVIHVDADAVGVEDGLSWTNAFATLEGALAAADTGLGTSIWIAEGTYLDTAAYVVQATGLSIYGGFDGSETNLSERSWTNNLVLLDGGAMRRVVDIQADDLLLDGLIITNGLQAGHNTEYGAGLAMSNGVQNLTVLNCRIVNNEGAPVEYGASCHGVGAYLNNAGTVLFSNCVFGANLATERGQGIGFRSNGSTDLTVVDCEVRDNEDTGGDMRPGKGFYLGGGTLTMVNTLVSSNYYLSNDSRVAGDGGGGYIAGGTASFTNCIFTGNDCNRSDGSGLAVNNGNVTIENCTFAGNGTLLNRPQSRGGGVFQNNGTVTIKNSIFWGNEAAAGGNQIYVGGGTMNIDYSCLEGTTSPHLSGPAILGAGIITEDPLFAVEYTDVHLKSTAGRWNGSSWATDGVSSPCIDAGDRADDYSLEPDKRPLNLGINMGAYGNTPEASFSGSMGVILTIY